MSVLEKIKFIVKRMGPSGRTTLVDFKNDYIVIFRLTKEQYLNYQTGTKSIIDIIKESGNEYIHMELK